MPCIYPDGGYLLDGFHFSYKDKCEPSQQRPGPWNAILWCLHEMVLTWQLNYRFNLKTKLNAAKMSLNIIEEVLRLNAQSKRKYKPYSIHQAADSLHTRYPILSYLKWKHRATCISWTEAEWKWGRVCTPFRRWLAHRKWRSAAGRCIWESRNNFIIFFIQ